MLTNSPVEPELFKFVMCEKFADFYGFPTDYVYEEFVNPENATFEQVKNILMHY